MAVDAIIQGDPKLPVLVCIPGLLGSPESFFTLTEAWKDAACRVIFDLQPQNKSSGLQDADQSLAAANDYDQAPNEIRAWLEPRFPGRKFYFTGVSLGGKVVIDFAERHPDLYAGGVVTDVGPGHFEESDLYKFITYVIPTIDLNRDWEGIKQELREKIPVKTLRVFIQTQVIYSAEEKRGAWKPAVRGLKEFMGRQKFGDQWPLVPRLRAKTTIVKAEFLSGISAPDFERLKHEAMFEIDYVPGAAHFVHVTHAARVQRAVLRMLEGA